MKALIFILVSNIGFLWACQKPNETVDGKAAIKSVSFVGISDKDVRLDAINHRIRVQLPAILPGGLQPIFELTDRTNVIEGLLADNTVDLSAYCSCHPTQNKEITLRVANKTSTSVYQLAIVATASLRAQSSITQPTFSRKTKLLEMRLPVENLYSNPYVDTILFTNLATGAVTQVNADGACLNSCRNNAANQLIIRLSSPIENDLQPGTYAIALGGIDFLQRLLVTD